MATNSLNAFMAGSDDDSVYLGAHSDATEAAIRAIQTFEAPMPDGVTDRGWITEDGIGLEFNDSSAKLRGHQGHGVVATYMSESDTNLKVSFLEQQLPTLVESLDIKRGKLIGTGEDAIAILDVPSNRQSKLLTGAVDIFNTLGVKAQFRLLLPRLSMGERTGVSFKVEDGVAWEYNLEVLDGFRLITNAPAIVRDSVAFAELLEELDLTPIVP